MTKFLLTNILILACLSSLAQSMVEGREFLKTGERSYQEGNYQEAIESFDKCIAATPSLYDAYLGRAMCKDQLKDYDGAIVDYSIFLEKYPTHFEALLGRANTRYNAGKFEQAKKDYVNLLSVPSGETGYILFQRQASPSGNNQITSAQSNLTPMLLNYIGLSDYKLKDYASAIHWLDSAIKLDPKQPDYYVNRGMAEENIDVAKAIQDYNQALKLNPTHSLALHNLAVLKSKKDTSVDFFESAIESDSTMLAPYVERAYLRMQSGYYKGALDDYNSALSIEKNDPELWLNRGFVKEKLNDLKGAYSDYTQAIQLNEAFEKAWLNRGNVLVKQNKAKAAIDDYTVAISIQPDYGAAYYNRAIAYEKMKQKTESCEDIKKAEKLGADVDPKLKSSVCP